MHKNNLGHILVTGGAGFIGSHLVERLLANGHKITIVDNFDPFYPRKIKENNIKSFINNENVSLFEIDIRNVDDLYKHLNDEYDAVIHLAAKAGVRPSIENPLVYQEVNVAGTQNLLEFARKKNIKQFVFGSSSSVYGTNPNTPWKESDSDLKPISPYASTKISGELLGHVYSSLYDIRFIALRFFTVFGPRQRPDLAIHSFSKKILAGEPINFFGDGSTRRDYTFVHDIVSGILGALYYNDSMYEVVNLGNFQSVSLSEMISTLEDVFEKKAIINLMPNQPGDVPITFADISKANKLFNYNASVSFKDGVKIFRDWLLTQGSV